MIINKLSRNLIIHLFNFLDTKQFISSSTLNKHVHSIISKTKLYVYEFSRMEWRYWKSDISALENKLDICVSNNSVSETYFNVIVLDDPDDISHLNSVINDNLDLLLNYDKKDNSDFEDIVDQLIYNKNIVQFCRRSNNESKTNWRVESIPFCYWEYHLVDKHFDKYRENEAYVNHNIRYDLAYSDYCSFVLSNKEILARMAEVYGDEMTVVKTLFKYLARTLSCASWGPLPLAQIQENMLFDKTISNIDNEPELDNINVSSEYEPEEN